MGTYGPPSKWSVEDPTNIQWGTDIDRAETTATTYSGKYGVHFLDTTPTVDPGIISQLMPIEKNVPIWYGAFWMTDRIEANDWVKVEAEFFLADKVTIVATTSVQKVLSAANTWQWVGEVFPDVGGGVFDVRWVRFRAEKNNLAYDAYMDRFSYDMWNTSWARRLDTTQAIPTGTWTTVDFTVQDRQAGLGGGWPIPEVRVSESAGVIEIGHGGNFDISAVVEFAALTSGAEVDIRLKVVSGAVTVYRPGTYLSVPAGKTSRVMVSYVNEPLNPQDTVEVQVWHNEGGPINVAGADSPEDESPQSYFRGARSRLL